MISSGRKKIPHLKAKHSLAKKKEELYCTDRCYSGRLAIEKKPTQTPRGEGRVSATWGQYRNLLATTTEDQPEIDKAGGSHHE